MCCRCASATCPRTGIDFPEWRELVLLCERLVAEETGLAGIVIGHGTATLEETAYFLNLTLRCAPRGAGRPQRPLGPVHRRGAQPVNAVRVAAAPEARGLGVLVVLNDEIQAAREVTKTATARLQTFRTPGFRRARPCGWRPRRLLSPAGATRMPDTEFDLRGLTALPRVDIAYAYAGADGAAVRAFVAAGAKGIVSAGFAPGFAPPAEARRAREAAARGRRGRAVHPRGEWPGLPRDPVGAMRASCRATT